MNGDIILRLFSGSSLPDFEAEAGVSACLRASEGFWEGRMANFGASDRISALPSLTFPLIFLIDWRQGR